MRVRDGNRGFIAERNYHTDLLWNYGNFKRLAALPRCHCRLGTLRGCPLQGLALPCCAVGSLCPPTAPCASPETLCDPLPPAQGGLEELLLHSWGTAGHSGALGDPQGHQCHRKLEQSTKLFFHHPGHLPHCVLDALHLPTPCTFDVP